MAATNTAALRATHPERGTARVCLCRRGRRRVGRPTIATAALASPPVATLLPLLAPRVVFEAVFALQVGVERIGRYVQVFHEFRWACESGGRANMWEHAAMAFGRPRGRGDDRRALHRALPAGRALQHRAGAAPQSHSHRTDLRRRRPRAVRAPTRRRAPCRRQTARDRSRAISAAEARKRWPYHETTKRAKTHEGTRLFLGVSSSWVLRVLRVFVVPGTLRYRRNNASTSFRSFE